MIGGCPAPSPPVGKVMVRAAPPVGMLWAVGLPACWRPHSEETAQPTPANNDSLLNVSCLVQSALRALFERLTLDPIND